jgi:hypothetical protein
VVGNQITLSIRGADSRRGIDAIWAGSVFKFGCRKIGIIK